MATKQNKPAASQSGIMERFSKWAHGTKAKYGTLSKVFTVVFLIALILLNVIVSVLANRFPSMNIDLTKAGLNTLSDKAEDVAKQVTQDTTIYMIGKEEYYRTDQIYANYNVKYSQVVNLAEKFHEINPHITYQFVDPDADPAFMAKYAKENIYTGYVVIESALRYKVLGPTDLFSIQSSQDQSGNAVYIYSSKVDNALANGVYLCNLEKVPVVAVATGHSEMLGSSTRASFDALLENANYEVQEFDIMSGEIPENAQILMLAAPATDYTTEELDKIDAYLNNKDNKYDRTLLVTFHPTQGDLPNLYQYLEEWGIVVGEPGNVIYESSPANTYMAYDYYIFGDYVANDGVVMGHQAYDTVLAPSSIELRVDKNINRNVDLYTLLQSGATSYVYTSGMSDADKAAAPKANHALVALSQTGWGEGAQVYDINVIACASSYMFTGSFVDTSTFDNRDYLVDLAAFATGSYDNATGLYVDSVETYKLDVTATSATVKFMGLWVFTVGMPAVILIYGAVVYLKRRHL